MSDIDKLADEGWNNWNTKAVLERLETGSPRRWTGCCSLALTRDVVSQGGPKY